MGTDSDQRKRCQELESENRRYRKQIEEQSKTMRSLQKELDQNAEKISMFGSRIVAAGDVLNEKKRELEKMESDYRLLKSDYDSTMEKHESEVNALAGEKKGLEEVLRAKDKEIARLNERIDSLLLASLDDNQKRADLQNEIEALEKQLKEKQPTPTPSPQVEAQSIMSSSSILELLGTTRQRVEELEETTTSLKKENTMLLSRSYLEKEEAMRLKKQCGELLLRESELQQTNRQLRARIVSEEARIAELTDAAQSANADSSANSPTGTPTGTPIGIPTGTPTPAGAEEGEPVLEDLKRQVARLRGSNRELLELLRLFSQLRRVPVRGTLDYLETLEKERERLAQGFGEERGKRRALEEQLATTREQLATLRQDYNRLVNPVEQLECSAAMHEETDVTILREALDEKLRHLLALGEQAKEAQRRHDEDQEAQRRLRERCIELEEAANRLQAEVAAREQRIGALEQEAEEKEKELAQEAESSTELLTALGDSTHESKQLAALQEELKKKEASIAELQDKLVSTEALNDFLQFSVQGEGEAASHSSTLTRLEEASKRTAGEVVEVSNAVVMFVYSLCEACSARGINAALCDQLVRQISHLGTRTGNPRFKEDVMKIVADAGTLVDGALAPYLQESEQKAALAAQAAQLEAQLEAEKEAVQEAQTAQAAQTAQCESYQKENEALKERLQQLEDLEAGTMKTMISLDAQDGDTMTQNSLNYLRRQNENLTASNQLYLKRIDELSAFVRTALDKTPAGGAGTAGTDKDARSAEAVQTLQKEVEREKGERLLWQTRCEQMEVVLGETLQNRSCITDYELSVLSSVVESLFTWVVDHFVTDLDLDIAIEPLEEEYTRSVRQMESREPLIMEVKLYAIQRIIETASNALMERRYQLEVAMEAERDRRRELEMELKK